MVAVPGVGSGVRKVSGRWWRMLSCGGWGISRGGKTGGVVVLGGRERALLYQELLTSSCYLLSFALLCSFPFFLLPIFFSFSR